MAENIEDNIHHEGFDVKFVTNPTFDFSCPICLLTMRNPVQTIPCSHQFCEDCITRHRESSAGLPHRCPVCNGEVEKWFPDGVSKRMILGLLIRCSNHNEGCLDTFELRSLDEHLLTCGYQDIRCTITNCEIKVQRRYLDNHFVECINRTVECVHCRDSYIFKHKQMHEEECKRFPVQCTNNCGNIVAREEMAMHIEDVCPKTIHDCKYINIICCKEKGTRKELAEHMEKHIKRHLSLAIDTIEDNKDFTSCEIKKLKDDKEKMSREIKELKDGKEKMSREIQELKDFMTPKFDFLYKSTIKSTLLNWASIEIKNYDVVKRQVEETLSEKNFYSDNFFCLDGYQAKLHAIIKPYFSSLADIDAYFVLIKGPYDDDLKWPFKGNIQFSTSYKGNFPVVEVSTSNLTREEIETYFKKPISENPGCRSPQFFEIVNINPFAFDDTLKIDVHVSKQ